MTKSKMSIRSRILIALGTFFYGEPKSFGVNCSAAEFYALPQERVLANPGHFHPANIGQWGAMRRSLSIDTARRSVQKHIAIIACVLSATVFFGSSIITLGVNKANSVAASIKASKLTKEQKIKRMEKLQEQALKMQEHLMNGKITEDDFKERSEEMEKEYQKLLKETQ